MSYRNSARYLNFSNEEDSYLIDIVKKHRVLYDIHDKDHRDFLLRAKLWHSIATKMERSVEECKKRWRSMKDTYYRFKRKKSKSTWVLMKRLQFLDTVGRNAEVAAVEEACNQREENCLKEEEMPPVIEESAVSNSQEPDTPSQQRLDYFEEYQPYDIDSTSESKYKTDAIGKEEIIRLIETKQRENEFIKTDPIFAFFHSMALSVRKLPPELVAEARVKVCELVGNLEIKAIKMAKETDCYADQIKIEEEVSTFDDQL